MSVRYLSSTLFLVCFFYVISSPVVHANKLYRWVDENGKTFFSDQIPPEKSSLPRDLLSKSGRVLQATEKAKTKEQLDLEKKLAVLRKEQEKIIAIQKTHDKALLSTFHTKEEILRSLQDRLLVFDKHKTVIEGNLIRLKSQLEKQQKLAADFDRNGEKVPQHLINEMKSIQDQIDQIPIELSDNNAKKKQVENEFAADIERFVLLTEAKSPVPKNKTPSIKEANELGLFYCQNDHQCIKAWEIGRTFVNFHSTTGADIYNDKLIMNRPPAKDSDLSLSLSKIAINENDYQLFLDVRCRDSSQGRELCASQKVKDIRSAFRPYINNALSRTAE